MRPYCAWLIVGLCFGHAAAGCRAPTRFRFSQESTPSPSLAPSVGVGATQPRQEAASRLVNPAAWQSTSQEMIAPPMDDATSPMASPPAYAAATASELDVDWLVAEVLARNPDVRSAAAAWRAASLRYPQEVALDDP